MWPFIDSPQYASGPNGGGFPQGSSGGWGQPTYVPPGFTPGIEPDASLSVEIVCPPIGTAGVGVKGAPVVLMVPPGATKYRVWFSPVKPVSPATAIGAAPVGLAENDARAIPGSQLTLTPNWIALGTHHVSQGSHTATLLVTFET